LKKLFILISVMFFVLSIGSIVHAASIGGAETQGKAKLAIGLDQEFVFNRDMALKKPIDPPALLSETTHDLKIDKLYRTMAKINYGLLENLDIYVKLGTADFKDRNKWLRTWPTPGLWDRGDREINGEIAFAYGFGTKGTYSLKHDWIIGCDIQYLKHKNHFRGENSWDDSANLLWGESVKGDSTFREWQVAPYIVKKIGDFVPYLGIKYSDLTEKYNMLSGADDEEIWKFKAHDNVGIFVGTDCKISEKWKLNLEGRFIDEKAMSFGATYRF